MKAYTEMMNEARDLAIHRMIDEAEQMGADAVVNVRFATSAIIQGAAEVIAYGTAVKFVNQLNDKRICVHEQVAKADCECPLYKESHNVNGESHIFHQARRFSLHDEKYGILLYNPKFFSKTCERSYSQHPAKPIAPGPL